MRGYIDGQSYEAATIACLNLRSFQAGLNGSASMREQEPVSLGNGGCLYRLVHSFGRTRKRVKSLQEHFCGRPLFCSQRRLSKTNSRVEVSQNPGDMLRFRPLLMNLGKEFQWRRAPAFDNVFAGKALNHAAVQSSDRSLAG